MTLDFDIRPVTAGRWGDFEKLFGESGACEGCWCMWFRLTRAQFERDKGQTNKEAIRRIIESGEVPGLLAYDGAEPAGWVSVAPREAFPLLDRSPVLKRVDERPAWSVVCFYIDRRYRGAGLMNFLAAAARDYAVSQGAHVVEGYPKDRKKLAAADAYTGLVPPFEKAGFKEVLRRAPTRPVMRYFA